MLFFYDLIFRIHFENIYLKILSTDVYAYIHNPKKKY